MASSSFHKKKKAKHKEKDIEPVKVLKHYDTFYGQLPPGLVKEKEEHPEDCIPDLPENKEAREFLAKAPSKGLWMPLGKEVKVMKCWRCKTYGHRTGDRECPMFVTGNKDSEKFRYVHEDPMHNFISEKKKAEKLERVQQLQALLESSDSSSSSDADYKKKHKKRKRCSSSSGSESQQEYRKKRKNSEKDGKNINVYKRERKHSPLSADSSLKKTKHKKRENSCSSTDSDIKYKHKQKRRKLPHLKKKKHKH